MKTLVKIAMILGSMMVVSCGVDSKLGKEIDRWNGQNNREDTTTQFTEIAETFIPYVEKFGCGLPEKLTMGFGKVKNNVAATCFRLADGRREIVVDKGEWKLATKVQKEIIIFHELGHCLYNLDHDDAVNEDGYPESIMNSQGFNGTELGSKYYVQHQDQYIDELNAKGHCE